jgi:hypothetical protein
MAMIFAMLICTVASAKKPPKKFSSAALRLQIKLLKQKNKKLEAKIKDFKRRDRLRLTFSEGVIQSTAKMVGIKTKCTKEKCLKLLPKVKQRIKAKFNNFIIEKLASIVLDTAAMSIRLVIKRLKPTTR